MANPQRLPYRNSTQAITTALFERTLGPLKVPAHLSLRPRERPFFDAIIAGKARAMWHPAQLPLAVQAAQTMSAIAAALRDAKSPQARRRLAPLLRLQFALLRSLGLIGSRAYKRPRLPAPIDDDLIGD